MQRIVVPTMAMSLLMAGSALGATSGTPLDTVYTQAMTMFTGPIAGLLVLAGLAVVAVMFMMGRGLEGVGFLERRRHDYRWHLHRQCSAFHDFFFPTAGALIR